MHDTAQNWCRQYLADNPKYRAARLGHGYNDQTHSTHVWVDLIAHDGSHLAADSQAIPPELPAHVQECVRATVPVGTFKDYTP